MVINTFLNLDFDNTTASRFVVKHILFSIVWILGLSIFFFRADIILMNKLNIAFPWIVSLMPFILIIIISIIVMRQKWYYSLALALYPILAFGWFIPKFILHKGKVYLFWNYANYIIKSLINFKHTLLKLLFAILSILLLLITESGWSRYFFITIISIIYFNYLLKYILTALGSPKLFGMPIEKVVAKIKQTEKDPEKEFSLIKTIAINSADKELEEQEKRQKQIRRVAMFRFVLNYTSQALNDFKGKRAFMISILFEVLFIFFISLLYFYLVNYQFYLIDASHFIVDSDHLKFDFFYYTFKSITFSDIESISPNSLITKSVEILSFLIMGVVVLVVLFSSLVSFKKERIQDNLDKVRSLIEFQNTQVDDFALRQFGVELDNAMNDVENINDSFKRLQSFLEKIF